MIKLKKNMTYIIFVAPAVIIFFLFIIIPLGYSVYYSFFNWNGIDVNYQFIGLKNFTRALTDTSFLRTIGFTLKYSAALVVIFNLLGILLALALNIRFKGRGFIRSVYFIPRVIGLIVIGYLWNFIIVKFLPILGRLTDLELLQKNWLTYPNTAFYALLIVAVWHSIGYYMIIYLTGLQNIPKELIEASKIDGVGPLQHFCYITLPFLRPALTICVFMSILYGLRMFDLNYSLTAGGPFGTTQTIAYRIYLNAFNNNMMSYACAQAIWFSLIAALISVTQTALMKRKEVEM